jgi:hypothetical protein
MALAWRSRWLWSACVVCAASSALAVSALDATHAGWSSLVQLCGRGDTPDALRTLSQWTSAYGTALHHTDIDKPTQRFVDDSLSLLSDFDLEGFYELLPEKSGAFRELWVRGELSGGRYAIRRADGGQASRVSVKGPRRGLLDMSQTVRARRNEGRGGEEHSYLLGARLGLGIGKVSWDGAVAAGKDFARLVASGDPRSGAAADAPRPSQESLDGVRKLHPKLAAEDAQPVALLFEAFPATARALSQLGELQDMRGPNGGSVYQHIKVVAHGLPERLAQRHPKLARHLRKLGKLARFDIRWLDAKQRSLMNWHVDSETLTLRTECYVKDGQLLPFKGKQVFVDEPVDLLGSSLAHTHTITDGRFQLLGVVVKISHLRSDLYFTPHGSHAELQVRMTSVPGVEVEGAALGFVPTGLIDAFIPGNMRDLTLEFFRVATSGNDEKGIVIAVDAGAEHAGGDGVLEASIDLEALDNRLVKMGVGMANARLVPDEDVSADDKALVTEIHAAFAKDLARFKTRAKAPQSDAPTAGSGALRDAAP